MPAVSPYSVPFGKAIHVKSFAVTRTMTAGTDRAFYLTRGCRILAFVISGGTASNAGTSATLSIGTTSGTPTEYVNAVSVLSGGVGNGTSVLVGVAGSIGSKLTNDTLVFVKYAESGTASSTGSWTVSVIYTTPGMNGAGTE